jgi:hypothetical protein
MEKYHYLISMKPDRPKVLMSHLQQPVAKVKELTAAAVQHRMKLQSSRTKCNTLRRIMPRSVPGTLLKARQKVLRMMTLGASNSDDRPSKLRY